MPMLSVTESAGTGVSHAPGRGLHNAPNAAPRAKSRVEIAAGRGKINLTWMLSVIGTKLGVKGCLAHSGCAALHVTMTASAADDVIDIL